MGQVLLALASAYSAQSANPSHCSVFVVGTVSLLEEEIAGTGNPLCWVHTEAGEQWAISSNCFVGTMLLSNNFRENKPLGIWRQVSVRGTINSYHSCQIRPRITFTVIILFHKIGVKNFLFQGHKGPDSTSKCPAKCRSEGFFQGVFNGQSPLGMLLPPLLPGWLCLVPLWFILKDPKWRPRWMCHRSLGVNWNCS